MPEAPPVSWNPIAWRMWGVTRIAIGLVFLWAFFDKLLGLGYSTPADRAWIRGGNPTQGYLGSSNGPFGEMFQAMAGNTVTNLLFMAGLLAVGIALTLGIAVRLGSFAGALMMLLMYLSHPIWAATPATHPFLDDHIVYALVLIVMAYTHAGHTLGLGATWSQTPLVKRWPWME